MRILIVTPYPPVLHVHGGGVRMFHNIRILAEKHRVHVLSFIENEEELELLKSVEPVCDSVTGIERIPDLRGHWFSLAPFNVQEFSTPAMHKAVDDALRMKKIDVIQCEYLQMAQYRRPGVFTILTNHEAYSANACHAFQAAAGAVEKMRLFTRWMSVLNYEVSMCNAFDRVVTMTSEDAAYLRSYAHRSNIRVIPIGIDVDHFQPAPDRSARRPVEAVFVGNFRHTPNVEAAEFLLEEIVPHFPSIAFIVAGSHIPKSMLDKNSAVFRGYVADIRQLFHSPDTVVVAPLFSGTGQRVKLLEAFAMGAAVVTTSLGIAGFPAVHGRHAMIADNPAEFRAAVTALAASPELRARLGREARQMIVDRFTWNSIGRHFTELMEELAAERR